MSSGNFIIGEGLSLEGFNIYIKPALEKYNSKVTDYLIFKNKDKSKLLISLSGGEGILERIVKISLDEAHKILEKEDKEKGAVRENKIAWPYQIKNYKNGDLQEIYETIGVYSDDETASKVFQNLAIKYSLLDTETSLVDFKRALASFIDRYK